MLLLVPQPLVAFDKMLEYINKMEGVDAILQEYGNLAGKPPQSTPIVRLYKSKNFVSWHETIISRHNTVVSRHDTTISRHATVLYITIQLYAYVFYVLTIYLLLLQWMNGGTRIGLQHQQLLLAKNSLLHFFFN